MLPPYFFFRIVKHYTSKVSLSVPQTNYFLVFNPVTEHTHSNEVIKQSKTISHVQPSIFIFDIFLHYCILPLSGTVKAAVCVKVGHKSVDCDLQQHGG